MFYIYHLSRSWDNYQMIQKISLQDSIRPVTMERMINRELNKKREEIPKIISFYNI